MSIEEEERVLFWEEKPGKMFLIPVAIFQSNTIRCKPQLELNNLRISYFKKIEGILMPLFLPLPLFSLLYKKISTSKHSSFFHFINHFLLLFNFFSKKNTTIQIFFHFFIHNFFT
jgi:hypothetical protein